MQQVQIQYWPTDKLRAYARNPRKNDHVVDKIVASIQEFGFVIPILAKADGLVIDGHLRLKGARRLEMESVPVIVCDHWTDAQVKAFRLLANRSASWAEWDNELLALELGDLKADSYDLTLTGFDSLELDKLGSLNNEDEPPAAPGGDEEEDGSGDDEGDSEAGADLMDPRDGDTSNGQDALPRLKWGETVVPITEDEADALSAEYNAYLEVNGMSFGFIRSLLTRLKTAKDE